MVGTQSNVPLFGLYHVFFQKNLIIVLLFKLKCFTKAFLIHFKIVYIVIAVSTYKPSALFSVSSHIQGHPFSVIGHQPSAMMAINFCLIASHPFSVTGNQPSIQLAINFCLIASHPFSVIGNQPSIQLAINSTSLPATSFP